MTQYHGISGAIFRRHNFVAATSSIPSLSHKCLFWPLVRTKMQSVRNSRRSLLTYGHLQDDQLFGSNFPITDALVQNTHPFMESDCVRGFQDAKDAVCVNLKHVKMNLSNPELLTAVCSSFEEFRDEPRMAGLMALVDNPGDSLLDLLPRLREAAPLSVLATPAELSKQPVRRPRNKSSMKGRSERRTKRAAKSTKSRRGQKYAASESESETECDDDYDTDASEEPVKRSKRCRRESDADTTPTRDESQDTASDAARDVVPVANANAEEPTDLRLFEDLDLPEPNLFDAAMRALLDAPHPTVIQVENLAASVLSSMPIYSVGATAGCADDELLFSLFQTEIEEILSN